MNIYYIGQDGYVKCLGDNELIHYNHNHDALGRFAKSNTISSKIEKRQNRINKREEKIDKLNAKINSTRNQKRMAKGAKYEAKLAKAQRKATRAAYRQARGKDLSDRDRRRLADVEYYKSKASGETAKTMKWEAKIADLDYKNLKDNKKIEKLERKYEKVYAKELANSSQYKKGKKYVTGK